MTDFDAELRQQLSLLHNELSEIKGAIYGPERTPYFGLLPRVEQAEGRITTLQQIQDSFVADQKQQADRSAKREQRRVRISAAVLATFGAILSGIVVQLFVLIIGAGP